MGDWDLKPSRILMDADRRLRMPEKLYLVKQEAWDAVSELEGVTRRPQPIVDETRAGMVMLAFPHHWWHPGELYEAMVVESTPHGSGGRPFYEASRNG